MKHLQCLGVFSILLLVEASVAQTHEPFVSTVPPHCNLGQYGGVCLDHNFNISICYDVTKCDFIFHCPKGFFANYTECYLPQEQAELCPDIATLDYDLQFNREYITLPHLTDPIQNSSGSPEEDAPCTYRVEDILSSGESVKIFELNFDGILGEMSLTTGLQVGNDPVKCYGRDQNNIRNFEFRQRSSGIRTRQFFRRYKLEIDREPFIYFCRLASREFALRRTNDIVGYSNISPDKYIAKIRYDIDFDTRVRVLIIVAGEQMQIHNLSVFKVMKTQNNAAFLYIQDLTRRSFDVIEAILNETLGRVTEATNKSQKIKATHQIDYLRNIDYCLPDTTTSNGRTLNWGITLVETTATPTELCLDNEGTQITRRCEGDFFTGAQWSEPTGNCSETFDVPERTYRLHQFIQEELITEVFTNITAETDDFKQFTSVDVNLLSDGLNMMSLTRNVRGFKGSFFHGVSNAMRINSSVLRNSQEQLNSTDKILDSIENFVANIAEDIKNLSVTIESNLLTQISYPFLSNVLGLGIYSNGKSNFSNYTITSLLWEETFDNLTLENLELAVYIPTDYIRNLTENYTDEEKHSFRIINTIFYNDGLFNDLANENRSAGSRVINVNIPGLNDSSQIPIQLLFRPVLNFTDPACAFWDYGRQRNGEWSTTGGQYIGAYGNESLLQCSFNHITHFALLVLSGNIIRVEDEDGVITVINPLDAHDLPLTLITLIGCGLSFMGLVGILVTAIVFKGWYKKRLNTIQLALVMLMEVIVLYVADLKTLEKSACLAVGALLHYIVVSKFIWMLIIARIQYLKFVKIFDSLQVKSHVIIHMLIGWILPIIPVMLGLLIFPGNYQAGKMNFCYPEGYALYFFIILPICIIILVNIAIFVAIIVSISKSKAQDYGVDMQKIQIRLGIMLLFMLGITWIFGIIGEFLPWSWFMLLCVYLFCILGSIQGFVLFVFTILLDKATMELWAGLFRITPKRDMPYERSTRTEVLFSSDSANVSVNYFGKKD